MQKKRAIKPDADPLAWARTICALRSPTVGQSEALTRVKDAAVIMVVNILENSKPSSDRTTAIRKVREALMFAREAILLEWEE